MEVDGFRFDLGTILGREPNGFDQRSGFFDAIGQDPMLSRLKLIGEPWDIGPGGYQVGGFPPGWAEWNDKYRDGMRDYWRGEHGMTRDLAARVTGSGDVYDFRGRRPWASVNFLTAHDGFTLNDLVSYNERHNEANGEDNKDGHRDNRSYNLGAEGPTDDAGIKRRARAAEAQFPRDLAVLARRADDPGRRRVRPHAERQQQRLCAGQRNLLGATGKDRRGRTQADRVHA